MSESNTPPVEGQMPENENTPSDQPTLQHDPDVYDERGVPWRNVAAEARRKADQHRQQYNELLQEIQVEAQQPQMVPPQAQVPTPASYAPSMPVQNGNHLQQMVQTQVAQQMAQINQQRQFEQEVSAAENRVYQTFGKPDDPSNADFYQAVQHEITLEARRSGGRLADPRLIELAAYRVHNQMQRNIPNPPVNGAVPPPQGSPPPQKRSSVPKQEESPLSHLQEHAIESLGLSKEKVAEFIKNDAGWSNRGKRMNRWGI